METPPLEKRLWPLFVFGSIVSAIRLALDAIAPNSEITMQFGVYWLMPLALAFVGFTGRWGTIGWKPMALTMIALGFAVWGVWNSIAYTTGQFMEWTHGRFDPGERVVAEDGTVSWENGRAAPIMDSAFLKVAMGLLHGFLSSLTSSVWCIVWGTVLVWLPARLRAR